MASQMVVPASKDTLFMRGFSSRKNIEDIRNFFNDEGGRNTVEFFKASEDSSRLYLALRFESKDIAREVLNRYDNAEVLGDTITISWFKDLRRARMKARDSWRPDGMRMPNQRGWSPDRHDYRGRYGGGGGRPYRPAGSQWHDNAGARGRRYDRSSSRSRSRSPVSASRSRSKSPAVRRSRSPSPRGSGDDGSRKRSSSLSRSRERSRSEGGKKHNSPKESKPLKRSRKKYRSPSHEDRPRVRDDSPVDVCQEAFLEEDSAAPAEPIGNRKSDQPSPEHSPIPVKGSKSKRGGGKVTEKAAASPPPKVEGHKSTDEPESAQSPQEGYPARREHAREESDKPNTEKIHPSDNKGSVGSRSVSPHRVKATGKVAEREAEKPSGAPHRAKNGPPAKDFPDEDRAKRPLSLDKDSPFEPKEEEEAGERYRRYEPDPPPMGPRSSSTQPQTVPHAPASRPSRDSQYSSRDVEHARPGSPFGWRESGAVQPRVAAREVDPDSQGLRRDYPDSPPRDRDREPPGYGFKDPRDSRYESRMEGTGPPPGSSPPRPRRIHAPPQAGALDGRREYSPPGGWSDRRDRPQPFPPGMIDGREYGPPGGRGDRNDRPLPVPGGMIDGREYGPSGGRGDRPLPVPSGIIGGRDYSTSGGRGVRNDRPIPVPGGMIDSRQYGPSGGRSDRSDRPQPAPIVAGIRPDHSPPSGRGEWRDRPLPVSGGMNDGRRDYSPTRGWGERKDRLPPPGPERGSPPPPPRPPMGGEIRPRAARPFPLEDDSVALFDRRGDRVDYGDPVSPRRQGEDLSYPRWKRYQDDVMATKDSRDIRSDRDFDIRGGGRLERRGPMPPNNRERSPVFDDRGRGRKEQPPPVRERSPLGFDLDRGGPTGRNGGPGSSFSGSMTKEVERSGALGLASDKMVLVRDKKEGIEKAYRQDCETFATVTKMLISKDRDLEQGLLWSLRENLKDVGQRCVKELRDYVERLKEDADIR